MIRYIIYNISIRRRNKLFINEKDYPVELSLYQTARAVLMNNFYDKPHVLETFRRLIEDDYNIGIIENFSSFEIFITPSEQTRRHYGRGDNINTIDRSTLLELFKPIFRRLISEYQQLFISGIVTFKPDLDAFDILKRIYDEYDSFVANIFNVLICGDKILLRL